MSIFLLIVPPSEYLTPPEMGLGLLMGILAVSVLMLLILYGAYITYSSNIEAKAKIEAEAAKVKASEEAKVLAIQQAAEAARAKKAEDAKIKKDNEAMERALKLAAETTKTATDDALSTAASGTSGASVGEIPVDPVIELFYESGYNISAGKFGYGEYPNLDDVKGGPGRNKIKSIKFLKPDVVVEVFGYPNFNMDMEILVLRESQNTLSQYKVNNGKDPAGDWSANIDGMKVLKASETPISTIYMSKDYLDGPVDVLPGAYASISNNLGFPDSQISSIKLDPRVKVTLFDGPKFTGYKVTLNESNPWLGAVKFPHDGPKMAGIFFIQAYPELYRNATKDPRFMGWNDCVKSMIIEYK